MVTLECTNHGCPMESTRGECLAPLGCCWAVEVEVKPEGSYLELEKRILQYQADIKALQELVKNPKDWSTCRNERAEANRRY